MAETLHWTYDGSYTPADCLAQGDILTRSDELVELLSQIHGHFTDEKYLAFLVVTQSCDLVRSQSRGCKASHISLAAIKSLDEVLTDFVVQNCGYVADGVYMEEQRSKASMFLERLLNQNESALGLFYLYPQVEAGIHDHAVAKLRVTISFKVDHYDVFQRARVGRLKSDFASKLGWLKGNLYSRVATTDWTESEPRRAEYNRLVVQLLDRPDVNPRWFWLPRAYINQAKSDQVSFNGLSPEECAAEIQRHKPKSHHDRAVARVSDIAAAVLGPDEKDKIELIARRLENDLKFKECCKTS